MSDLYRTLLASLLLTGMFVLVPDAAYAYGGPGSVISGIGTFLALVAALVASLFGFLWFPLKRLYKKMTVDDEKDVETTSAGQ